MTLPAEGYRLTQISPKAYEHPADRAATAALKAIPHLDAVIRTLIDLGYERALRQAYLGAAVRLGERQLPDTFGTHQLAYKTLDVEPIPDLYLTQFPLANAMTIGAKRPIVVLQSGLADLLDETGLRVVCAHEAGHVLSDHVLYRTALQILLLVGSALPGIASLPLTPLKAALLEWQRAGELTCDRAAALVTRDPVAVCRVLMILASGSQADRLDLDEFMRQGAEYREPGFGLGRLSRLLMDLRLTHPMPVQRAHELMEWVKSGDYDRIAGGDYARRGDPARAPREEASDAVEHYTARFKEAIGQAGESVEQLGQQLGEWLRRNDRAGAGPP